MLLSVAQSNSREPSRRIRSNDYISRVSTDAVEARFGGLAPGKSRSATLQYRAASTLANEAVINLRATYSWEDERGSGTGAANWTPVLIGAGDAHSPYLWMSRTPEAGRAGTQFQFFSDRFQPGEGVVMAFARYSSAPTAKAIAVPAVKDNRRVAGYSAAQPGANLAYQQLAGMHVELVQRVGHGAAGAQIFGRRQPLFKETEQPRAGFSGPAPGRYRHVAQGCQRQQAYQHEGAQRRADAPVDVPQDDEHGEQQQNVAGHLHHEAREKVAKGRYVAVDALDSVSAAHKFVKAR